MYWFCAIAAFIFAIGVMITIERFNVHDWWRYLLYIGAMAAGAAALFGVLHSSTQRIGIIAGVVVLAWRALSNRTKAVRAQGDVAL